jgi:enterochelin esterase-like enzyme
VDFGKRILFRSLFLLLTVLTLADAEESEPPESPQILKDHRVIFRYQDATAKNVAVKGIHRTLVDMKRGKHGLWSVQVDPIDPGLYDYSFIVDGEQVIDPSNPSVKPDRNPDTSSLEITSDTPLFYQWSDVPHGTVHLQNYFSKPLTRLRRLRVYTPPGYEQDADKHYPVLYLFHGTGDTEATWTEFGRAHLILDNLIAAGKAVPMLLVMPDGHADLQGEEGDHRENFIKFETDVLDSVIPLVDSTYRTIPTSAGRAINGLSLGGMQSLEIGMNHAELFTYVGGMSAYVPEPYDLLEKALQNKDINKQLKLLRISIGKNDFLLKDAENFHEFLLKHDINVQWKLTPGSHEWTVWRLYLRDFAPLLFRAEN